MVIIQSIPRRILEALKGIGLNLYERNIYVALLLKKVSTASELSSLSGVPRARTYDVLDSLEKKGFVIIQHSTPFKYVAVEPSEAFDRLKEMILSEAKAAVKSLDELKKSKLMIELDDLYKKDLEIMLPSELSGVIKSADKISLHIRSLLKKTQNYVNILTTEKGLIDLTQHVRNLNKLNKSGVEIKIIAPVSKRTKEGISELLSYAKIKDLSKTRSPYGRLHIYDGKHAIVGLLDDEKVEPTQDMVFWTNSEHVAGEVMLPIFNTLWDQAKMIK
ncbi:MAG: hypothetical protein B6U88_02515 [Candidatus Aenigmarchaeota archaeon ex4484_56]|nr:MAG: hypothetical protein B6U88_02515 [Candidatus Aenigmarchaeota archaeon ex4484_56]